MIQAVPGQMEASPDENDLQASFSPAFELCCPLTEDLKLVL